MFSYWEFLTLSGTFTWSLDATGVRVSQALEGRLPVFFVRKKENNTFFHGGTKHLYSRGILVSVGFSVENTLKMVMFKVQVIKDI